MRDFELLVSSSPNGDRFDILYEFSETSDKLISKILQSLNLVREHEVTPN